jgi:hypothetical protein
MLLIQFFNKSVSSTLIKTLVNVERCLSLDLRDISIKEIFLIIADHVVILWLKGRHLGICT